MHTAKLVPALLLATCLACGGGSDPTGPIEPPTDEPSQYSLQLGSYTLIGNLGVDTNWDDDLGIIYLGSDDIAEPIGTVTLLIGPISSGTNGGRTATITDATVSTSRVRVGTGEELDAKLWRQVSPVGLQQVTGIRNGDNFIEGTLSIELVQVSPEPEGGAQPAVAMLTGTFRAVNN